MSKQNKPQLAPGKSAKITVPAIRARKGQGPIVCLTAYSTPVARIIDPLVDLILVGDSVGMTLYGFDSTLPVTLDMMIQHGAAVVRGAKQACVVIDMPFATYQESREQAYRNSARVLAETGCNAVKLEGGVEMADTIEYLTKRGIAVMGHIGLQPQSVQALGGYKAQGMNPQSYQKLQQDALAIDQSGAFCMVIEAVTEELAQEITSNVQIPTIGIGASPACDGQVLVLDDILGMDPTFLPKFAKRYADLSGAIETAVQNYAREVRGKKFPSIEHCFSAKNKPASLPMKRKA